MRTRSPAGSIGRSNAQIPIAAVEKDLISFSLIDNSKIEAHALNPTRQLATRSQTIQGTCLLIPCHTVTSRAGT